MDISGFLYRLYDYVLNPLILLATGVAFVYFIYGIVRFLSMDATDKSRVEARNAIMWGILGMVVMFSVYGIVRFVMASFGLSPGDISPTAQPFLKV